MYSESLEKNILKFTVLAIFIIGGFICFEAFSNKSIQVAAAPSSAKQKVSSDDNDSAKSKMVNGKNVMFYHPTHGGVITSAFGNRWGKLHKGMDISRDLGTDVVACLDGVVKQKFYEKDGYGNIVILDHGNGFESRYAHLNGFNVDVGQKVKAGNKIATVGTTGRSTGPHLHFEVRINDNPIDPQKYIK